MLTCTVSRESAPAPGLCRAFFFLLTAILLTTVLLTAAPAWAVFGDGETTDEDPVLVEIRVEGATRTDPTYVRREMGLAIGEPLSRDRMDEAWDHLEDLGRFAYIDMEYDDFEEGEVALIVTIEEEDTIAWGPRIRYSQRHKYLLGGWAENTHWRGKGETLRAELTVLYIQRAGLSWTRPWLFGQKGLELTAAASSEQADFVYRPFRYRRGDLDLAATWSKHAPWFVTAGVAGTVFRLRDDFTWPAPDRGDETAAGPEAYEAATQNWLAAKLAVGVDTRTNPWYPSRGVFAQATARRWESGDFDGYTETSVDLRAWVPAPLPLPVLKHQLLALRAWGRTTSGAAHLDNVCFLGGSQTVRGHGPDTREGDTAYLLTVEYRLPIAMMKISPQGDLAGVGVHVFGDAGDAWFDGAEAGRALQGWGAGMHLNMDRVQVRFEAARTIGGDWSFEFGDRMTF